MKEKIKIGMLVLNEDKTHILGYVKEVTDEGIAIEPFIQHVLSNPN